MESGESRVVVFGRIDEKWLWIGVPKCGWLPSWHFSDVGLGGDSNFVRFKIKSDFKLELTLSLS